MLHYAFQMMALSNKSSKLGHRDFIGFLLLSVVLSTHRLTHFSFLKIKDVVKNTAQSIQM